MENMVNTTTGTIEATASPATQAQLVATPVAPAAQPDMSMYMLKSEAQKRTKRGAIVGGIAGAAGGLGLGILGTSVGKKIGEHKAKKNSAPVAAQDTPQPAPAAPAQPQLMQITPEQLAQLNAQMAATQATAQPAPAQQVTADNKKK